MSGLSDVRTEEEVVAAMLLNPIHADAGLAELEAADFSDPMLRRIFSTIAAARMDEEAVDAVSIRRRILAAEEGCPGLEQRLFSLSGGYSNPGCHAPALRAMRLRRDLSERLELARMELERGAPARGVADTLSADANSIVELARSTSFDGAQQSAELARTIRELQDTPDGIVGLRTGLSNLDRALGGLRPQQMILLGARPGQGKTALAMTIAESVASRGLHVLTFSMEMSLRQMALRRLSMASGISTTMLASGTYDQASLRTAEKQIESRPLTIETLPDPTASQIVARMKVAKSRGKLDLAIVDHIGLIRTEGRENRTNEVSKMSRMLKSAAMTIGVPILVLCQFSRSIDWRDSKIPSLADYRDSGQLEADADVCIGIHAPHADDVDPFVRSQVDLFLLKNRDGRVGRLPVHFDHQRTLFRDRAVEADPVAA